MSLISNIILGIVLILVIVAIILSAIALSRTSKNGATGPQGPVGPAGPAGPQGEDGHCDPSECSDTFNVIQIDKYNKASMFNGEPVQTNTHDGIPSTVPSTGFVVSSGDLYYCPEYYISPGTSLYDTSFYLSISSGLAIGSKFQVYTMAPFFMRYSDTVVYDDGIITYTPPDTFTLDKGGNVTYNINTSQPYKDNTYYYTGGYVYDFVVVDQGIVTHTRKDYMKYMNVAGIGYTNPSGITSATNPTYSGIYQGSDPIALDGKHFDANHYITDPIIINYRFLQPGDIFYVHSMNTANVTYMLRAYIGGDSILFYTLYDVGSTPPMNGTSKRAITTGLNGDTTRTIAPGDTHMITVLAINNNTVNVNNTNSYIYIQVSKISKV